MKEIKTRRVRVTVIAEATDDSPLDPGQYTVTIKSNTDSWFDMYPESVVMAEEKP